MLLPLLCGSMGRFALWLHIVLALLGMNLAACSTETCLDSNTLGSDATSLNFVQVAAKLRMRQSASRVSSPTQEVPRDCDPDSGSCQQAYSREVPHVSSALEATLLPKARVATKGEYVKSRVQEDSAAAAAALAALPAQPSARGLELADTSGSHPKTAFLFLLMQDLDNEDTWDAFFASAPQSNYSIYIHQASALDKIPQAVPLKRWGAKQVTTVNSRWCALMGVQVALLAAALQDESNEQFIFLSQNTIPLKSFQYVYSQLVLRNASTSKVCLAAPAKHRSAIWEFLSSESSSSCMYLDFYHDADSRTSKHHQWIVLSKDHAQAVIDFSPQALQVYANSAMSIVPDVRSDGCSDEVVPMTSLLLKQQSLGKPLTGNISQDLNAVGVEENCLTFVSWRHCLTGTRLDVSETELSLESIASAAASLLRGDLDKATDDALNAFPRAWKGELEYDYLQRLTQEGFMFARKFTSGVRVRMSPQSATLLALHEVLPSLWDQVQADGAAQRIWRRLDAESQQE